MPLNPFINGENSFHNFTLCTDLESKILIARNYFDPLEYGNIDLFVTILSIFSMM
jgi:hypothetical protein